MICSCVQIAKLGLNLESKINENWQESDDGKQTQWLGILRMEQLGEEKDKEDESKVKVVSISYNTHTYI